MQMKMNQEQLLKLIKEAVRSSINEEKEVGSGLSAYVSKVNKFVENTIEEANKLRDEGAELINTDVLKSRDIHIRNGYILERVGLMKSVSSKLAQVLEKLRKTEVSPGS